MIAVHHLVDRVTIHTASGFSGALVDLVSIYQLLIMDVMIDTV